MPFTPIHFGPGLLLKALAPNQVSLTGFVLANVVVDLEPLYHILRADLPLHGPLHSLLAATAAGAMAGAGVALIPKVLQDVSKGRDLLAGRSEALLGEFRPAASLLGGALGGFSHAIFDALIYSDFHPLAPFSTANPLLGFLTADELIAGLLLAGLAGLGWLLLRRRLPRANRRLP